MIKKSFLYGFCDESSNVVVQLYVALTPVCPLGVCQLGRARADTVLPATKQAWVGVPARSIYKVAGLCANNGKLLTP